MPAPGLFPRLGGALVMCAALTLLSACSSVDTSQNPASLTSTAASGDGSLNVAEQGEQLSAADAARLEQSLKATPDNLTAREQLVGYYFVAQAIDLPKEAQSQDASPAIFARDRHLLWLIQKSPGLDLLSANPMGVVQPSPDAAAYAAASAAWSNQLAGHPGARVEGNAGIFFAQTNDPRATGLLAAAAAGDGKNPTWPGALGDLYVMKAKMSTPGSTAVQQAATSAVTALVRAWNLTGGSNRDPRLSQIAKLAVIAGQDAKAVQYATVLLNTFQPGAGQAAMSVGGPIHDGNMVLGQVALRRGDRNGAEQYLLKAGATPGSPILDRYGPNFSLARDLLAAGSRDAVMKYCDEVAKFWSDPKLATWRAAIAAGKTPDFGDNLWV